MDVQLGEHGGRDLAGVGARFGLVHRLREHLHARATGRVDHRRQRRERRADRHVDVVGGRNARQQGLDEILGLGDGLVHLPVARDQRSPTTH
jgi:hypothetical protein